MKKEEFYRHLNGAAGSGPVDPLDKCEMGLIKLLAQGQKKAGFIKVDPFENIAAAYVHLTGDSNFRGVYNPKNVSRDLSLRAGFNSTSFATCLSNAMNIFMSMVYREFPYHEEILISKISTVKDFRPVNMVQFGYFPELPDIDPEAENYNDIEEYEETSTLFNLKQKGVITWVTRKMVVNNDVNSVRAIPLRLARSARLSHAKYVWNFFTSNLNSPDGTPWFSIGHGNLSADALDITPLTAAVTALANMTEPGSGETIGLDLASLRWNLVVPVPNWSNAVKKNQCDSTFTGNDLTTKDPNPCYRLFGDRNERIVTCPFVTGNDWGVIRDREDVPILEMSYLNGQREPELMTYNLPNVMGQYTFVDDKLGFKVRHEYGGALGDYRGGFKSVCP